jgi:hypothetical protein
MKNTTALLMALGLALPAMSFAQDAGQRPPPGDRPPLRDGAPADGERPPPNRDGAPNGQRPPMVPPLFAALDTNHDGVIDEEEIKNAAESLKKLDKNGDGKITPDEIRPARPDGDRGPGLQGDGREGAPPRGNREGVPGGGQRPPRRDAAPPPADK